MIEYEVMGHTIREGTEQEIRAAWAGTAAGERWRYWSAAEVDAHILDTPQQLLECFAVKRAKPGRLA